MKISEREHQEVGRSTEANDNGVAVPTSPAAPSEAVQNLDKIRDILFGQQVSEQQQHLQTVEQKLEQKLARECSSLRNDFSQRLQAMEDRLSNRINQLTQTVERESEKANTATQDLQAELKHQTLTLKDSLEEQIYDLISQVEEETRARKASTQSGKKHLSTLLRDLSDQLHAEEVTQEDT